MRHGYYFSRVLWMFSLSDKNQVRIVSDGLTTPQIQRRQRMGCMSLFPVFWQTVSKGKGLQESYREVSPPLSGRGGDVTGLFIRMHSEAESFRTSDGAMMERIRVSSGD